MIRSVVASLLAHAASRPDAPAYIDEGREIGYGALARAVESTAAQLHARGVRAGDTIGLALDNARAKAIPLLRLFYALDFLGAKVLMLYPDLPASRREQLIERFAAKRIDAAELDVEGVPAGAAPRADDPDRPFLYQFTSGSTGEPKTLLLTNRQLAARAAANAAAVGTCADDRMLSAVCWPYMVGLRHLLWTHAASGTFVNVAPLPGRPEFAALVRRFGITQVRASPGQLRRLLQSAAPPDPGMPVLRALLVAGAPMASAELAAVRRELSPNLFFVYGASEIGVIAVQGPEDPVDAGLRLAPQIEAQVVGPDHGPLAQGSAGMLRLRAPWLPQGYAGDAGAEHFRDGWFYPGDTGMLDAGGRLILLARSDDLINCDGVKVDPQEIEQALAEHPMVADVAVVGVPDALAGERQVAFVTLSGSIGDEALLAFWRSRIEAKRMPRDIRIVPALERSPDGKILRGRLREIAAMPAQR